MVETPSRNYLTIALEELAAGQAQVRATAPRPARRGEAAEMARILLGVSGGIAAYKALELARLATKAGHARAGADDPDGAALRRRRLVRGDHRRAGARRRVRARPAARRLPGRSGARPRPDRPPRAGRQRATPTWSRRLGEHDRQARRRASPTRCSPPRSSPAPAPRARRAGDERPHVRATPRPRPTSRRCASAACT